MSNVPKNSFPIATTIPIREAGDEYTETWLQDQICDDPSILKLGELDFVTRERIQCKNGRLDILLKDATDAKMYVVEVKVMLGETDETVWDRPKPVPFTNPDRFLNSHAPEFGRGGWTFTVQGKKSPSFLISPHPSPQINPHTLNLEHGLG